MAPIRRFSLHKNYARLQTKMFIKDPAAVETLPHPTSHRDICMFRPLHEYQDRKPAGLPAWSCCFRGMMGPPHSDDYSKAQQLLLFFLE
jgi:hypothetical protein